VTVWMDTAQTIERKTKGSTSARRARGRGTACTAGSRRRGGDEQVATQHDDVQLNIETGNGTSRCRASGATRDRSDQVRVDERQAADDRGDGEDLADDDDLVHVVVVVEVGGMTIITAPAARPTP